MKTDPTMLDAARHLLRTVADIINGWLGHVAFPALVGLGLLVIAYFLVWPKLSELTIAVNNLEQRVERLERTTR